MPSNGHRASSDFIDALAEAVANQVLARMGAAAPTVPRKFFSIKEAAAHLGLTEKAFRHVIITPDFPERAKKRIGRKILIEKELLDQWLNAH